MKILRSLNTQNQTIITINKGAIQSNRVSAQRFFSEPKHDRDKQRKYA